ncbi:MAG: septum formation inhibitor Maf [Saprospiraceae bacterium]
MKILFSFALFSFLIFSAQNCSEHSGKTAEPLTPDPTMEPVSLPEGFNEYWYAGKAELCTYDVTQERYGEIRQAEQVNVFVTEDFSRAKQVKLDDPALTPTDRVPVLKLNLIRRFHTGIYDYSIMQSVFTPVNGLPSLKTTTTVQDWCGQVFMQNNLEKDGYHLRGFSYFESEGEQDLRLPFALLEDEIWTRIRLNPSTLTTSNVRIIPSAIYTRLRHKPIGAQNAEIKIEKGENESVLKIVYSDIPRSLSIRFTTAFPYKILAWEETHEGKIASKGELKATIRSAYWETHDNANAPLRDSLKLRF